MRGEINMDFFFIDRWAASDIFKLLLTKPEPPCNVISVFSFGTWYPQLKNNLCFLLLLYSLRCGCVIILIWTLLRALFFLVWFIITAIEVFLPRPPPLGSVYPEKPGVPAMDDNYFFVFVSYIFMIVTESFLTIFTIYLGMGLYYDSPGRIEQYLICRFCTWLAEVVLLVVTCLTHSYLIGWYLVFLMIVIIEFYAFIVVYSYYVDMMEDRAAKEETRSIDPTGSNC